MNAIQAGELPQDALLQKYRLQSDYADCYFTDVPYVISQAEYVEAFYTTWLFRIERTILSLLVSKPSTDLQAKQLAAGETENFAAWSVEDREPDQLLMCDFQGRTRSWLMSVAGEGGDPAGTRLYFGSAVVADVDPVSGRRSFGFVFHALMGFHRLYSRALLRSACARLLRSRAS